ncbi:hypothetical protein G3567_04740 [Psychroflexus sp. YR1-1]|uniref:Uncharacterized protein n=1 Tax=Psychroflexus aurantiacus TaxID=2709310 RepID=A0A6B3R308_9FLAO|nr:hypothetical protein [Psychroflexus aurantiacus]NEV93457.1 hypothetical protein [Psychroflexus aurantiacus]
MELNNNGKTCLNSQLIDSDYGFQKTITKILKIIFNILRNMKLENRCRADLNLCYELLVGILNKEQRPLKPTTRRLREEINQTLLENKDGDGVLVVISTKPDYKFERMSKLNFNIYGN